MDEVIVGPETGDDAGVFRLDDRGLVATADFIMPVCDDPRRFGRVAAANSLSDVWAMGGRPIFALNLCMIPRYVPDEVTAEILAGAADVLRETRTALLGGHSVRDEELKYGLAVVGLADPCRLLTNAGARPGDRLLLTKPLGTGVLVNAFKAEKIDEAGLEPALAGMERLNDVASHFALGHGAHAATDVTGFGLAGHALTLARASGVALQVEHAALPSYPGFAACVADGISTGCTELNARFAGDDLLLRRPLDAAGRELLFDPQTSGGLLIAVPAERAAALLAALLESGHQAAAVGNVVAAERPTLEII